MTKKDPHRGVSSSLFYAEFTRYLGRDRFRYAIGVNPNAVLERAMKNAASWKAAHALDLLDLMLVGSASLQLAPIRRSWRYRATVSFLVRLKTFAK